MWSYPLCGPHFPLDPASFRGETLVDWAVGQRPLTQRGDLHSFIVTLSPASRSRRSGLVDAKGRLALDAPVMRGCYLYPQAQRPLVQRWFGASRYDLRPGRRVSVLLPPRHASPEPMPNSIQHGGRNFHADTFQQYTARGNTIGVPASACVRCLGRLAEVHGSPHKTELVLVHSGCASRVLISRAIAKVLGTRGLVTTFTARKRLARPGDRGGLFSP